MFTKKTKLNCQGESVPESWWKNRHSRQFLNRETDGEREREEDEARQSGSRGNRGTGILSGRRNRRSRGSTKINIKSARRIPTKFPPGGAYVLARNRGAPVIADNRSTLEYREISHSRGCRTRYNVN